MNYALAFLTSHGREREAAETLASFELAVSPRPSMAVCHVDGPADLPPFIYGDMGWSTSVATKQQGFCKATSALWDDAAALTSVDFIFWLEDDFKFVRAIDLLDVAHVMVNEPQLAQMAFMRQPCNDEEERVGSFILMHPEAYAQKGHGDVAWLEHHHHWTTNPSLIRHEVVAANEWPLNPFCEGWMASQVQRDRPGTSFGIWGVGDPWVHHFGVRSGSGY